MDLENRRSTEAAVHEEYINIEAMEEYTDT